MDACGNRYCGYCSCSPIFDEWDEELQLGYCWVCEDWREEQTAGQRMLKAENDYLDEGAGCKDGN